MAIKRRRPTVHPLDKPPHKPTEQQKARVFPGASPFAYKNDITFEGPPCRTLADMSPEEIRAIEAQYGMPVRPRKA